MNIIKEPSVELWRQEAGVEGVYKHIERCARVCYRSENKGTMTSEEFVKKVLIKKDHGRALEFGTLCFKQPRNREQTQFIAQWAGHCPWVAYDAENEVLVTNLRFVIEHCPDEWEYVLSEIDIDTDPNQYRPTLLWHIARGIADEFRTHGTLSGLMESTRWCNYQKKGLDFMLPRWAKGLHFEDCYRPAEDSEDMHLYVWMRHNQRAEEDYTELLRLGMRPEQARGVLNLDIATHLVQCGFPEHWFNFFYRRQAKDAHEDARYIANQARELLDRELR